MNLSGNMNHIIIGSVVLILSLLLGYKFIYTPQIENNNNEDKTPKIVIKEDNIINEYLEKEFSKVLKVFSNEVKKSAQSMVKFNDNFLLKNDYLNFRNSLYTKDIEKHHVLIDTKNLCHCSEKHSYEINFTSNDNNESGGYGVFKNVIGFRLIKATLQNLLYQIHDGNNKVYFNYGDNTVQIATLKSKSYTSRTLGIELERSIKEKIGGEFNVRYSSQYYKYFITTNTIDATFNIDNYIDGDTTGLGLGVTKFNFLFQSAMDAGFSNYRLFGFDLEDQKDDLNNRLSTNIADLTIHYVDLEVKEIPYIACKKNPTGKSIIDRIPVASVAFNAQVIHKTSISEYFSQNYFYPITLSKLSIVLYEDSQDIPYYNENADNYFEFEITILKNTKLSN